MGANVNIKFNSGSFVSIIVPQFALVKVGYKFPVGEGYALAKQPTIRLDGASNVVSVEMKLDLHISLNIYNVWVKMR